MMINRRKIRTSTRIFECQALLNSSCSSSPPCLILVVVLLVSLSLGTPYNYPLDWQMLQLVLFPSLLFILLYDHVLGSNHHTHAFLLKLILSAAISADGTSTVSGATSSSSSCFCSPWRPTICQTRSSLLMYPRSPRIITTPSVRSERTTETMSSLFMTDRLQDTVTAMDDDTSTSTPSIESNNMYSNALQTLKKSRIKRKKVSSTSTLGNSPQEYHRSNTPSSSQQQQQQPFSMIPSSILPLPPLPWGTAIDNRDNDNNTWFHTVQTFGEQILSQLQTLIVPPASSSSSLNKNQVTIDALNKQTEQKKLTTTATVRKNKKKKKNPMPIIGYNAQDIIQHYDRVPWIVLFRLYSISLPFLSWYIQLYMDEHVFHINYQEDIQRQRGVELRQLVIHSQSVALIKSGQALSLRPDLIQNRFWAEELSKLVDAVGGFEDTVAMNILLHEWNAVLLPMVLQHQGGKIEEEDEVKGMASSTTTTTTTTTFSTKTTTEDRLTQIPLQSFPMSSRSTINSSSTFQNNNNINKKKTLLNRIQKITSSSPVLSALIEFENDNYAVASASIGQVYKGRLTDNVSVLTSILGSTKEAMYWKGKMVAIKIQRPDVVESASLDMYLLRRAAEWMSRFRGGDLIGIADTFGTQLFGELDYIREANNCQRFHELYHDGNDIVVPQACLGLTTKKVLVLEWVDGEKGPWKGQMGLDIVQLGLKCSVDQLLNTGLFHADPHRGNLLRTPEGKLAFIDFGMMADVTEEERYGLIGLAIGLQNKDLSLVTENLLKLGFLDNTSQLDQLVPRLRQAFINSTGGTGKSSDVNFSRLQGELDAISRENNISFLTPPFFTVIIRSLTILEGFALSVDPNFRLVRGAYPYVLAQLVSSQDGDDEEPPQALQNLLMRLLTVNGEGKEIEWERLRDFLILARKAQQKYEPQPPITNTASASTVKPLSIQDRSDLSRQTMDLFFRFLTSKTGLFLKKPLVHELAEIIDGIASIGESNLLDWSRGFLQPLPGGAGPINPKRMDELRKLLDTIQDALTLDNKSNQSKQDSSSSSPSTRSNIQRLEYISEILKEMIVLLNDLRKRDNAMPLLGEIVNVIQLVAVEVLEIRTSRAVRRLLQLN